MQASNDPRVPRRPSKRQRLVATLGALFATTAAMAPVLGADATPASAAVQLQAVREVQPIDTMDLGITQPVGVAYLPTDDTLVVAARGQASNDAISTTRLGDAIGDLTLPAGEVLTLTADPGSGGAGLVSAPDLAASGVQAPAGAAFDRAGRLLVLDDAAHALIATEPGAPSASATRIPLDQLGPIPVRGVAVNPADGLTYVGSPTEQRIYGLDANGAVQTAYDLSSLELEDQQSFVFAPSADGTDDPAIHDLFVADAGDGATPGRVMEASLEPEPLVAQAVVPATLVQRIATSAWSPASPDPSGIEYLPGSDRLVVVDSEVEEVTGAGYHDVNLWQATRAGAVTDTGTTWTPSPGFSREPNGLGYDAAGNRLFISDDSADHVWIDAPGGDGRFGTADDSLSFVETSQYGSLDPEDPEYDPSTGHLFFIDGVNVEVYDIDPVDGVFGNGNDAMTHFDIGQYGPTDIEGLGADPVNGTLLVGGRATNRIYEVTKTGALVRTIDGTGVPDMRFISGLVQAPASNDSARRNYWVVDRNLDNGAEPAENDGQILELTINDGGAAPVVDAGPDQSINEPVSSVTLHGTVTDDGLPNPPGGVTHTWSQVGGPAVVTFANAAALDTTANGLTLPGDYTLRLSADDGSSSAFDELVVHVVATVAGGFVPLTPSRLLDTREGNGAPLGKLAGGATLNLQVTGRGGVPSSGVRAVVMNVTVTAPTLAGHVTVWPTGVARPNASNLNFVAGQTVPNLVTVGLGSGGRTSLFLNTGAADLIADVVGYYADTPGAGARYQPVVPNRILDSRDGTGGFSTPWSAGQTRDIGLPGVPADATAVALNVTETGPTGAGHATVWPSGLARPNASNLNFVPGWTSPNLVVVGIGANQKVSIFNHGGSTHYIADLVGYYRASAPSRFTPITPTRVLDSRDGTGGFSTPWASGQTRDVTVANIAGVPANATAVVVNVTTTGPTAASHLTVWPSLVARPNVSNLNFVAGQTVPNLVMVQVGANQKVSVFNQAGSTHVIADVVGYFR